MDIVSFLNKNKFKIILFSCLLMIFYSYNYNTNNEHLGCLFGCSDSSSTVTQKYDTTVINKSDISLLNETINEFTTNTVVNQAANCSSTLTQSNIIEVSNVDAEGDIIIEDVAQDNTGKVSFDCIQKSSFSNEIANGILTKYLDNLNTKYTTDALDKLNAQAASSSSSGFLSTGSASSDTEINTDYKFTNITNTRKNIQNVVRNSIVNNLNLNDVQDCVNTLKAKNVIAIENSATQGKILIRRIEQRNATDLLTKCIQEKNNSNKITGNLITDLGLTVVDDALLKKSTEISSEASAVAAVTGPLQDLGSMFSGIFGSLSGWVIPCVICSICIVSVLGVVALFVTQTAGESGAFDPTNYQ